MKVYVRCLCGNIVTTDPDHDQGQASCAKCGLRCVGPQSSDGDSPPRSRLHLTPPAWALVCLLALCAALLWAMATPGGGGDGTDTLGDDPYAGRRIRGVGDGDDGEGSGGGADGAGAGAVDTGEGSDSGPDTETVEAGDDSDSGPDTEAVDAEEGLDDATGADEGDEEAQAAPPPVVVPVDVTTISRLEERDTPVEPEVEEPDVEEADASPAPAAEEERTPFVATGGREGSSGAGGAGKPYAKRGDQSYARKMGATEESEEAVDLGLAWLARVQCDDGHWCREASDSMLPADRASPSMGGNDAGYTGLAVLAFLGAGHTHKGKGPYSENVRKALEWLLRLQKRDGSCMSSGNYYEQGIAATALCEAYGMTKDPSLRRPAQGAVHFILQTKGKQVGFGYRGQGDDVHVTSFQVMAIKSAKLAGLRVGSGVFEKLRDYYDRALGPDYTTGYTSGSGGGSPRSARTALGLFCRLFLDCGRKDLKVQKIADLLDGVGPQVRNVFQTYYGTYGMFQMGGDYWTVWNEKFRDATIALQIREGIDHGAWPRGSHCKGMVDTTALRIMSLEVYYRYLPVNK